MEKIMILGAGRGQIDLIRTAKKMGYVTVVASIEGDYPGFEEADEVCYVDISDPEAVSKAAKACGVNGIATACLNTGINALGYTCDQNGFIGLSEYAAEMSQNKLLMKAALIENGVSTAQYRKVSSRDDLKNICEDLGFPLIIKAVDLQGSRGINIARNEKELYDGYEQTMGETGKDYCIIEEFIEGYEFGVQSFVYDGDVLFILPCGNITYRGSTNVPVGHYAPFEKNDKLSDKINDLTQKAIKALNLNNCAVNLDMIVKDEEVYIIELTGRLGANCLPQIISIYYGIDIYKMIIDTAMGNDPRKYFNQFKENSFPSYAKMLLSEETGKLLRIVDDNTPSKDIFEITYFVEKGDFVRKFTNSKDCIGQIVVTGNSLTECKERCETFVTNIRFELEKQ